jgi:hypothetical protein
VTVCRGARETVQNAPEESEMLHHKMTRMLHHKMAQMLHHKMARRCNCFYEVDGQHFAGHL